MWGGMTGAAATPGAMYAAPPAQPAMQSSSQQKHDIFVGNLAFNTTEEQLHQAFSEIGKVIKVRLVTDMDTGKPRGFAFIEFEDPQAALSAIRNMNDYELNGRRIRVNFSNSSHLEALAGKLGMDLSQQSQRTSSTAQSSGTQAVADSLKGFSKGEMYDVIAKLKEIADRDPDEARRLISGHPQLPEAILFLMSKLEMVKTPVTPEGGAVLNPAAAGVVPGMLNPAAAGVVPGTAAASRPADPRARAIDPRAAAAAAAAAATDPRASAAVAATTPSAPPSDPRAAGRVDPRAAARAAVPAPTIMQPAAPQPYTIPPPMQVPPAQASLANLDPSLVSQVMSLTPQQIAGLPPDKQQSILALRQQITGGRMP